jgi:hypothetical protein
MTTGRDLRLVHRSEMCLGYMETSLRLPASVSVPLFFALLVCSSCSVQIAGPPKVYVSFVHLSSLHSCDFPSVLKSVPGHGTSDHHMWPLHPSDICLLKAVRSSKAKFCTQQTTSTCKCI